jgi:uncharacterized protein (DUF952 family)
MPNAGELIYHMCLRPEWELALRAGVYTGSSQDLADGFIHFSTAAQLPESARRHRSGQADLVLLAVDPRDLGESLRWEPSRRGALFPHLYGSLPIPSVRSVAELPLAADGVPLVAMALASIASASSSGPTGLVRC